MKRHHVMYQIIGLIFSSACASSIELRDGSRNHELQMLCPYTDFCHSNATKVLRDKGVAACCFPCSCEDGCWNYGTCCKETQNKDARGEEIQLQECRSTIVKGSTAFDNLNNGINRNVLRYSVVSKCPKTEKNETLKLKCTSRKMFKDLVWVTDRKTNMIYNNEFCAACHGVESFKQWNLKTGCTDLLISDSYSQEAMKKSDYCSLMVTPSNSKVSAHRCYLPDITECNVTGRLEMYDRETEQLCNEYRMHYFDNHRQILYNNVYCYLCNEAPGAMVHDKCLPFRDDKSVTSFSAILDLSYFGTEQNRKPHGSCNANEVEDPLKLDCLRLYCPSLWFPWYGTCRKKAKKIYFLGLRVRYMFYPNWDKMRYGERDRDGYSIESIATDILREVHKELGLKKAGCGECREFINVFNVNKQVGTASLPLYLALELNFYTNKKCEEELITTAASKMIGKEMLIQLGEDEYITFDVHEGSDTLAVQKNTTFIDVFDGIGFCKVRSFFYYTDFLKCPTVILDGKVYNTLMSRANTATKIDLVKKQFGFSNDPVNSTDSRNISRHVCLEDYKRTVAHLTSSSKKLLTESIVLAVAATAARVITKVLLTV